MTHLVKYRSPLKQAAPLLLALAFFAAATLNAQYTGGQGDGFARALVIQLTFDGIPAGVAALYVGGSGDGFDRSVESFALSGENLEAMFQGSSGDGFDRSTASLTLNGEALLVLYGGGSGDGFDRTVTSVTLSGGSTSQLYGGGDGDGFDRSIAQLTLDGSTLAALFGGGSGDGFDVDAMSQALTGQSLEGLFGGGPGDGFDARFVSVVVGGETLAQLFGGGQGDGFDAATFAGTIPLPLDLISFDAFPEQGYVLLKWATENEQATDFFTIEKTADGFGFADVGNTDAAGYSEPGERLVYEMKDDEPYQGRSFYRLKTTDFDGMVSLSHLVEVQYAETEGEDWKFTLFPNPNTGRHFSVRTEGMAAGENVTVEVFDINGRALFTDTYVQMQGEAFRFDLASRLTSGSYLVRVVHPTLGSQAKILLVGK